MFCKRTRALVFTTSLFFTTLIVILIALESCARPEATAIERLGVMPIENLSSDAQLDWRSRAAAAVVVYDLAGAKKILARQVDSLSAAQSMQALRLLEGYFFERNGRIALRATVEDLARNRAVENFEIDGAATAGFLPLLNELARRLSSDARTFGTSNENAFRFYGEALSAKDSKDAEQALQQATGADSGFAAGYLEEAKVLVETGNRDGARRVAAEGERARLDPIDRANLEYVAASARGDTRDRVKALESLTNLTPANANIFRELGEMRYAGREFQRSAIEFRAAARLDAENPQIWNQLGYALAYTKDLKGAREALGQYQKLAPGDANALDSQGEVSYMLGDFKSAGEYFERAAARNPSESLKAAEARLMLGDLKGADEFFLKHFGPNARGRSAGADYQMAQWEYLTGRRSSGMARMEKLVQELSGDLQALALSQLSIWKLQLGDREAAKELAKRAAQSGESPQVGQIALMCESIAAGELLDPGPKITSAYALLFAQKYRDALPLLQDTFGITSPSADGQVRTLLAWAYVETGAVDKAASLVNIYPLPLSSGDPLFASLTFPRFLAVRAAVLERQGKVQDAKSTRELYSMYAGATK